mgnify:CR=1 FL=1
MRWTNVPSRCCCSASCRCSCSTAMQRLQAAAAVEPAGVRRRRSAISRSTPPRRSRPTRTGRPTAARSTMSYFTQMAGLAYHNFVSAAVGIARGDRVHPRHRAEGEGHARQLLGGPGARVALGAAADLRSSARCSSSRRASSRTCKPYDTACTTRRGRQRRSIAQGPVGVAGDHQAVRHQRRRLLQRQQRASVREPDAAVELPGDVRHLRDLRPA